MIVRAIIILAATVLGSSTLFAAESHTAIKCNSQEQCKALLPPPPKDPRLPVPKCSCTCDKEQLKCGLDPENPTKVVCTGGDCICTVHCAFTD